MTATTRDAAPAVPHAMKVTRAPWQVKFIALAFIWGSSFLLMKIGLRSLAPLQISDCASSVARPFCCSC
jgi:hypothetical protein